MPKNTQSGAPLAPMGNFETHLLPRLKRRKLWPIRHDAEYYRRVARTAPEFLVRAVLLHASRTRKFAAAAS